jgi:hypothetical protein
VLGFYHQEKKEYQEWDGIPQNRDTSGTCRSIQVKAEFLVSKNPDSTPLDKKFTVF